MIVQRSQWRAEKGFNSNVPQGSGLEPTQWNVLYDTDLRLKLSERRGTVAYADDLALIVRINKSGELIEDCSYGFL